MATRRRSKLEAKKPPPIAEIDKSPSAEDNRPKSASDDTGHLLTESSSCQNDIILVESEIIEKKSTQTLHPITAVSKDERLRNFLNVFVGLPVSDLFKNSENLVAAML